MGPRSRSHAKIGGADQICLQWTFSFPGGQKMGFGGFSLEGKVCGRASRLCPLHYRLHCEYKGHILFTFERAHVFLTINCMGLVRVNKE